MVREVEDVDHAFPHRLTLEGFGNRDRLSKRSPTTMLPLNSGRQIFPASHGGTLQISTALLAKRAWRCSIIVLFQVSISAKAFVVTMSEDA